MEGHIVRTEIVRRGCGRPRPWYRRVVGDTDQPDQMPVAGDPDDGQHSVQVELEPPALASARPLANIAIVLAVLAMLLVVHGRSSAGGERTLRTTDPSYIDTSPVVTTDPTQLPAVVDAAALDPLRTVMAAPHLTSTTSTSTTEVEAVSPPIVSTEPTATIDPTATAVPAPPTETAAPAPVVDAGSGGGSEGVSRAIPDAAPPEDAALVVSPWADKTSITGAGYVATDVGCASGTSAASLDAFFRDRVGPAIGFDYQHVYALGGRRYLWVFQDTFLDYSGVATNLGQSVFAHNTAMIQDGSCFTLYHRGSIAAPTSFEPGTGGNPVAKWFWPMGGQTFDGRLYMFWAQMERDGYDPKGADGLGWHPVRTWLAVYDAQSLKRLAFQPAANSGTYPIYGYAVDSDDSYTYLFGNTFEQNLQREGGYANGPHSGTLMFLARVARGDLGAAPEYWSNDAWTADAALATPISQRYWAENPMQPRYLNGQWVAATKVDGYWGDELVIDVANDPWGPWATVEDRGLAPRGGDPSMNTYHAYLMPWLSGGSLVVSASNNARNMYRDAWPNPSRYRPMFFGAGLVAPPPREDDTTTTIEETTTVVETTTSDVSTTTSVESATTTTVPTTTTTEVPTTTTTTTMVPTTTTSTTTAPPTTLPASSTTTPTTEPPPPDSTTTTSTTSTTLAPDPSSTSTSAPST